MLPTYWSCIGAMLKTDCQFSPTRKKFRLFRSWTSGHPMWCAWQVTYRCNFRCRFCGYWNDPLGAQPEPDVEQYARGARKLARYGSLMVSLAGGEPMLREDLPDIVREIGRYHFPFMTTNGWFVTEESARAIMEAGLWGVSISIDYADAKTHDAKRGMPGAYEQAWRAVELFSKARVHKWQRVNVISVLMDDNLEDCMQLVDQAADHHAYYMVQPYCYRKTGSRAHYHQGPPVSERLLKLAETHPNFASSPAYLARFDDYLNGGIPNCRAGKAFFNIDSTGNIAICVEHKDEPVANLFHDDAGVIHQRLKQAATDNPCTDCWYNCRGEIESLYTPYGLLKSMRHYLGDEGKARRRKDHRAKRHLENTHRPR
jgi:MoaA/NifB/PqqE/SkfB family radical SAM enzyme